MKTKYLLIISLLFLIVGAAGLQYVPSHIPRDTYTVRTPDNVTISYTLYRPASLPAPVVVIGHGVSVNKEMMEGFAVDLAANGYIVAVLDWRGHGRSTGELRNRADLLVDLDSVINDIPSHVNAKMEDLVLMGYSMGGSPTYQYASTHNTAAWIGLGTGIPEDIETPDNTLVVIGKYDEAFSPETVRASMGSIVRGTIEYNTRYGSFTDGSARKVHLIGTADHLIVPWHPNAITSVTRWVARTFGEEKPASTFLPRMVLLVLGTLGFLGLLYSVSFLLTKILGVEWHSDTPSLSVSSFLGRYYEFTLLLVPSMILFVPLFFTPLPFTALITMFTGGFGVGVGVCTWRILKKKEQSIRTILSRSLSQKKMWLLSLVITVLALVSVYLLIGRHFLGMVPSMPKLPYLPLYILVLFVVFLFYTLFIQKIALPILVPHTGWLGAPLLIFLLIYSWFAGVILGLCLLQGSFFLVTVLIMMAPIFLFMSWFSAVMERLTGSILPSTVLHAVLLGTIVTAITPFTHTLNFL